MPKVARKKSKPSPRISAPKQLARKIVGVGASAGGLEAFTELVKNLPTSSGLGFVLVQHLDPTHRSLLSELLGRSASIPVQEIEDNTPVLADHIHVIPPNCNLSIEQGVLKLTPREKKGGPARSIDHFLRALAADQGRHAIGVILSGAGSDGAKGLKAIKEVGGVTFAQDAASSKYDSMPRSAIAAHLVDFVLPPEKIASEIARIAASPNRTPRRAAANARDRQNVVPKNRTPLVAPDGAKAQWPEAPSDPVLRKIFLLLRTKTGVDFSLYRMNTIRRRLKRRCTANNTKDLESYWRILRESPAEVDALYQDLLIHVTSFFRNPGVFETLKKKIFPQLVKNRAKNEPLRFWVAGCSTGQEPYSLAMAFAEFCEKASVHIRLQIFATDLSAAVLETARVGRYTRNELDGLSQARIRRFFQREGDTYRIDKSIRDTVVFAQQNVLTDPPFTRVDLVSCRNMLIYIEPALQQRIIPTFHYALRPNGFLLLGASESIGTFTNLFAVAEKNQKIYIKKPHASRPTIERVPPTPTPRTSLPALAKREPEIGPLDIYREADRLLLTKYSPPSVVINDDGVILHFRGKVQPFLEIAGGKATFNLFKMARGSLGITLQQMLDRARTLDKTVREDAVVYEGLQHVVNIEIVPIRHGAVRSFLVLFEKIPAPANEKNRRGSRTKTSTTISEADTRRLSELKHEFNRRGDQLDTLREQHETVVEELQATNEEVQSSNEELQSLNEELETSNEELESANEELATLNEELATRNTELRESEQRLREQAQLVELAPLLARSPKDRIIFWSRGAEKLYGFTKDEALGQNSHLLLRAQYPEPLEKIHAHLAQFGRWEGEVHHRHKDGTTLIIATQWVTNLDDQQKIRAILEVNTDITLRRQAEDSLRKAQQLNQRILESSPDCIMVLDLAGRLQLLNPNRDHHAQFGGGSVRPGIHWNSLWSEDSRGDAENAYRTALGGGTTWFQAGSQAKDGSLTWWDVVLRPISDADGHPEQLLAVCRNITERKKNELAAQEEARLVALRADIGVEVARGGELAPILQQLAQILVHHTDVVLAQIWLKQPDTPALKLSATAGIYLNTRPEIVIGEGRIGGIAATKRAHITHQITDDPDVCDSDWARREGLTSFAGYPLLFESKMLGVLTVMSRVRLEARLLREIGLIADAIALVIQRKTADDERARLLQDAMNARNTALAASRAKDDFLATLSHELRTPLNPVLLLASDGAENPEFPPHIRSIFETIRNNVRLEAKLIDDLLDLTRITHGKLELDMREVDINTAVAEAVEIVSSNLEKHQLVISLNLEAKPSIVTADPVRLQQVLWNILNNAAKFTPKGGQITILTTTLENHRVLVRITDSGVGMREADLERVFNAFLQLENRKGGLGLGLAISRQILELHNGNIRALSEGVGKGSTFEIELPLLTSPSQHPLSEAPPPAVKKPAARKEPTNGHGREGQATNAKSRILLVEDHPSTRSTLRTLLVRRNFDVVIAGSVEEGLTLFDDGSYDLVVSDLGLPDGSGHQLLSEIRKKNPHIKAIALSGYGTEEDRARSRDAGFGAHLTKPVSIDILDKTITAILP